MRMMVTPVAGSPASRARWIGAAPRQRGSSEAWMLRQPSRGNVERGGGKYQPVRDHDQRIDLSGAQQPERIGSLEARGLMNRQPEIERAALDGAEVQRPAAAGRAVRLREDGRDSGAARPAAASAGTAKSGVPAKPSFKRKERALKAQRAGACARGIAARGSLLALLFQAAPNQLCASARRGSRRTTCLRGDRFRAGCKPPSKPSASISNGWPSRPIARTRMCVARVSLS